MEENKETKDLMVSTVVDVAKCRERAAVSRGMAAAVPDRLSQQVCVCVCCSVRQHMEQSHTCSPRCVQRGESLVATARYNYTVRPTAEGGVIAKARALEQQRFSTFNVKGGSFEMRAT